MCLFYFITEKFMDDTCLNMINIRMYKLGIIRDPICRDEPYIHEPRCPVVNKSPSVFTI